jgi:trehalose-6-phosphate synthase
LLGNDLLGFHLDRYRENFLRCVDAHLPDASVDHDANTVAFDGQTTHLSVNPVGVDPTHLARAAKSGGATAFWQEFVADHGLDTERTLLMGVDRLDYTKGIVERLDALEHLLETRPHLREAVTLVQKSVPTRERIPAYREYARRVEERIAAVNDRFRTADWQPVVHVTDDLAMPAIASLYRHADVGVVTPRRDGMNLVAKEFVAASHATDDGTLVLSEFAGAADALGEDALLVNPFDTEAFATTLERAVEMHPDERRRRLDGLFESVEREDIAGWRDDHLAAVADCAVGHVETAQTDGGTTDVDESGRR